MACNLAWAWPWSDNWSQLIGVSTVCACQPGWGVEDEKRDLLLKGECSGGFWVILEGRARDPEYRTLAASVCKPRRTRSRFEGDEALEPCEVSFFCFHRTIWGSQILKDWVLKDSQGYWDIQGYWGDLNHLQVP